MIGIRITVFCPIGVEHVQESSNPGVRNSNLKYDRDLGRPNVFAPISEQLWARKIELLLKHFKSQSSKHWFSSASFAAMHRIRGVECVSVTGRAEVFYYRKMDPEGTR
jgi:hypothetical protein